MSHDSRVTSEASPDRRIDKICDAYEAVWSKGGRPQINDFLAQCEEVYRAELFYELLLVELEFRRSQGERPTLDEYLRDFPQFAQQIEAADFHSGGLAFATTTGTDDVTLANRIHQPGSRIDHFELVERLGAGAMGEVWKAQDTRLRRFVALKLPRAETLTEADLRRFLREGQAAAQLRHPRLAAVHQVGREGKTVFIVADYVDGDNLKTYLAAHSLSHAEMAELCAEVAEALHHAHELEIVHRDLKPANIIVDRASKPHVIDFGLAKWSNDDRDLTLHGELLGTPAYMSPEQADGASANLDRRTDVYSLGVILYEMLTGSCPFTGDRGSVIHQILAREPVPPRTRERQIPRDLDTICVKALEKDPDRRYATLQEMSVDLRRFARGEPILARRAGPLEKSWRWTRRHPGISVAAVLLVAAIAAAGAVTNAFYVKSDRLGKQPIVVNSVPPGAHVLLVPVDPLTGEPNRDPSSFIEGTAPLSALVKPGDYLVEALLPSEVSQLFGEKHINIPVGHVNGESRKSWNRKSGFDKDSFRFGVRLFEEKAVTANMALVLIPEKLRRMNPLLPERLYVDPVETKPGDSPTEPQLQNAEATLERMGKRLPTAAEYDAIIEALKDPEVGMVANGKWADFADLPAGLPEWTSTGYRSTSLDRGFSTEAFKNYQILCGNGGTDNRSGVTRMPDGKLVAPTDSRSPLIGYRGVRSGAPRFMKP